MTQFILLYSVTIRIFAVFSSFETFGRVFALINPKEFEASCVQWVQGISQTIKGMIAIDGRDAGSFA